MINSVILALAYIEHEVHIQCIINLLLAREINQRCTGDSSRAGHLTPPWIAPYTRHP